MSANPRPQSCSITLMSRCSLAKMNFEREFLSVFSEFLNKSITMVVTFVSPSVLFAYVHNLTLVCFCCQVFFHAGVPCTIIHHIFLYFRRVPHVFIF